MKPVGPENRGACCLYGPSSPKLDDDDDALLSLIRQYRNRTRGVDGRRASLGKEGLSQPTLLEDYITPNM